ncbi:ABC transporter substrate-binding protein [uncultured Paenibacillus sp.]|uniref:ABC transporter substrate-binding protein n=1 Tax=uncultured Paenibacillus sp. TaxID=227322 RepID=UPI0015A79957|nr:ABC transporter substrate-binding protein [uncultured Paenibacillus sp.]
MKKTLAWLMTIVCVFGLTACSSGNNASSSSKVTLTLLSHYTGENEKFIQPYIEQWNQENPDIQVKLTPVEFDQLLSTMMTKQTAGQVADIVHTYTLWGGQLSKNKVLAPAPDDVAADIRENYPASAVAAATIDGKVVGYPTEVQAYGLFYNKKLLKEAGFDQPPKTWDELLQMASAIEQKDKNGKTTVQGFGFLRGYAGKVVQPFMGLLATAGGTLLSEDMSKPNLDSDAAKQTIDLYSKIYGSGGISDIGFETTKAFGAGQVAMTIEAGWWAGSLKTLMKDGFADVGAAPLPSPDGQTQGSLAYTWAFGVNSKSKHQEAAWKFLKWFNSVNVKNDMTPEGNFLIEGFNTVSARKTDLASKTIQDKLAADPIAKTFSDALQVASPEQNPATASEIQDILYKQIENMWAGKATKEEVLESVQKDIQAKLGQ